MLYIISILLFLVTNNFVISTAQNNRNKKKNQIQKGQNGEQYYLTAKEYYNKADYVNSASYFWLSLLFYKPEFARTYQVEHTYNAFLQCFRLQDGWHVADGYGFLAYNYFTRDNSKDQILDMLNEAKKLNPYKSDTNVYTRIGEMVIYEEEKKVINLIHIFVMLNCSKNNFGFLNN